MCGRFSLKTSPDTLERIFGRPIPAGYRPRFNVAPTQEVLALVSDHGETRFGMLRWGLIPFWARDPSIGNRMINARCESVAEKGPFRDAFQKRRCLVVADGFYEWQTRPGGRYPMWVRTATGEPFAFAGLWERWRRGAEPILSCTILTTDANPFMARIHDRMPVILGAEEGERWLSEDAGEAELREILDGARSVELQAHEVSTLVNNPSNDVPECIEPVETVEETLTLPGFE